MKSKGFYIFCDESVKKGKYYSNFYGGVLLDKNEFERINNALISKRQDLRLETSELKWSYVNTFNLELYKEMINVFFDFIKGNFLKVRIMFTDNRVLATKLTKDQRYHEFQILYYHFIKHAFGLSHIHSDVPLHLELFFDKLPDKNSKNEKFKGFIYGLQFLPQFANTQITIDKTSIYEVESEKHIILQCLDVVLGSMAFRLNDMHKEKPVGQRLRGKRTVAKEKLYKHINKKIREIRPNFNIGISTGTNGEPLNKYSHPYRHWLFIPTENEYVILEEE